MKKILISLLCCLMVTVNVSAQINKPTIDSETGIISVSGKSSATNSSVMLMIAKPGNLIDSIDKTNIKDKTIAFYEFETAADGAWSGQFTLPATATGGRYNVYVTGEYETAVAPPYFYYASPEEITSALNAVKSATIDTLAGVLHTYTVTNEILAIDLSGDYFAFTSTTPQANLLHTTMLFYVNQYQNLKISNVTTAFNKAIETTKYAFGTADDIMQSITNNKLGITIDAETDKTKIVDMYLNIRKQTGDASVIEKTLRTAVAMIKINEATKGEMTAILSDYNDVLGLDLTGTYATLDKVEVNKALVSKNFVSLETLQNTFNASVEDVLNSIYEEEEDDNYSSGGGKVTSSISFGGGSSSNKPATPPVPVTPVPVEKFSDIGEVSWAKDYINELAEKKIINGVGDGLFAPMNNVTREEYLKMIVGAFGVTPTQVNSKFDDVDENAWYAPYVAWGVENGIINGVDDSSFGVGMPISREQMAVISVRTLEKLGYKLDDGDAIFADKADIAEYAELAVSKIQKAGIISGMPDGRFAPKDNLTRAQAAKVICLVMKVGGLNE